MTAVELARGQNAPLASTRLTATVELPAAADLSALLLTADAKVRGDSDIVFYNQPEGPGVRCVPPSGGQPWQLHLDLAAVPAEIAKVRVVTSLDEAGRTFGSRSAYPCRRMSSSVASSRSRFAAAWFSGSSERRAASISISRSSASQCAR